MASLIALVTKKCKLGTPHFQATCSSLLGKLIENIKQKVKEDLQGEFSPMQSLLLSKSQAPNPSYLFPWEVLEQILCYEKGALSQGILYSNHGYNYVECFSGAHQAGSKIDQTIVYLLEELLFREKVRNTMQSLYQVQKQNIEHGTICM